MRRRAIVWGLLCVLLSALPPAAHADGPVINVGAMPIAGAAQAFYAQEQGFFKAAGLDVNLVVLPNGAAIVAAAAAGSVDIGFGSPSPLIQAHVRGLPVRFITYASLYTGPPVTSALMAEPWVSQATDGARVIGNLNDIVAPRYALAGWFATNAWLTANPQLAQRFIAVMQQTARWANTHPKEAGALLQRYTKVTPDVAVVVLKQLQFDDAGRADPKYLQPVVDLISRYGKTPAFNAADLIWSR